MKEDPRASPIDSVGRKTREPGSNPSAISGGKKARRTLPREPGSPRTDLKKRSWTAPIVHHGRAWIPPRTKMGKGALLSSTRPRTSATARCRVRTRIGRPGLNNPFATGCGPTPSSQGPRRVIEKDGPFSRRKKKKARRTGIFIPDRGLSCARERLSPVGGGKGKGWRSRRGTCRGPRGGRGGCRRRRSMEPPTSSSG